MAEGQAIVQASLESGDVDAQVTAIVVNYNGRAFAAEAVESLLAQRDVRLDVIVVDNASTDGSGADLGRRFEGRIDLVLLDRNLGFGAGNNVGIRRSAAEHVVLLNNDAVATRGFVAELLAVVRSDPRIGMVAPKVLGYAERDVIDTVGHLLYPDGINRGRGRLERDRGQYDDEREALFPSGAAALYRRAMLDEIGLFDEAFFLYGEDADLGLRARLAGWKCALAPRAVAYHRYSGTVGPYSLLKAYYVERNRVWVLLKSFPIVLIALSPIFTATRLALQAWGALSGRGAAGRVTEERALLRLPTVVLRAYASALRGLPGVLRQRWRDRRLRRLSAWAFLGLLRSHRLPLRDVALKD